MNILLDGYFDQNFGDDVMVLLAAEALSKKHKLYIFGNHRKYMQVFKRCPHIEVCDDEIPEYNAVLKVVGSGFLLHNHISIMYAFKDYLVRVVKNMIRKDKPTAVIGCNVGPFVNWFGKWLMMQDIKRHRYISVRDAYSYSMLKSRHIKSQCYYDIVFGLPQKYLKESTGENCLGISAYRRMYADNTEYYKTISALCNYYIKNYHKKVILMLFDTGDENDYVAANEIMSDIDNFEMCDVVAYNGHPENIIDAYSRCKKIIGIRFHSIVLAMRMGISVLPISYSEKTDHLLSDLRYSDIHYNLNDISFEKLKSWVDDDKVKPFGLPYQVVENARKHASSFEEAYFNVWNFSDHSSV